MTDSPPKVLQTVPANPVTTPQSVAQVVDASSVLAQSKQQSVAKRKLELQLDEIRLEQERMKIEK